MSQKTFNQLSDLIHLLSEDEKKELEQKREEEALRLTRDHFVIREEKRAKGKTVTIVEGFTCADDRIEEFALEIKQLFGLGGTVKDRQLILQGKVSDKLLSYLNNAGYKVVKK